MMGFVRALLCCACSSLGLLLFSSAAFSQADDAAGADGGNPAVTNPAAGDLPAASPAALPASTPPDAAQPPEARAADPSRLPSPSVENNGPCLTEQACIDQYLWSLYQRTPKVDTVKVSTTTKVTVKHKGKTRTVTKKDTKLVTENFAWKDPKAADQSGMALIDYVIGGMDPGFRTKLYRALHTLDDAGFKPGIMCAFRDDYRQSIATGLKAQNDRSYHGGSFRGGYGHGLAADIVSVQGNSAAERSEATGKMWDWIDKHEKELGIGRPYLNRDPPHIAPLDGEEYADHRLKPKMQLAEKKAPADKKKAQHASSGTAKPAKKELARKELARKELAKKDTAKKDLARKDSAKLANKLAKNKNESAKQQLLPVRHDQITAKRGNTNVVKSSKAQSRGRMPAI